MDVEDGLRRQPTCLLAAARRQQLAVGWYAASDGSVRSKGTMYFVMHPHGISATGRWVGLSYDGNIVTGWSSMARTEADARELVGELKEQDAPSSR